MGRAEQPNTDMDPTGAALPSCPKCWHPDPIRSGMVQGQQRWKCRECSYQFTRVAPRGRPLWQKSLAVFLYSQGVPLHRIGAIFHVRPSTVLKWVKAYAGSSYGVQEMGEVRLMKLQDLQQQLGSGRGRKKSSGVLCIAIDDTTFRENVGISITQRQEKAKKR